ncbi:MAG: hypothetical protein AB7D57_02385 [Desulfovibrionaceae bacterium]
MPVLVAILWGLLAAAAPSRALAGPRDAVPAVRAEAAAPDFAPTLAALRRVVARRDVAGLLALVHPEFRVAGRPIYGLPGFREYWLQSPERDVWTCLAEALRQAPLALPDGGRCLWAPSAAAHPRTPTDFDTAVLAAEAGLRAGPGAEAPVLAVLPAGGLLRYVPREPPRTADGRVWRCMAAGGTPGLDAAPGQGREGWVEQDLLRSPLTLRFHFALRQGRWLLDGSNSAP